MNDTRIEQTVNLVNYFYLSFGAFTMAWSPSYGGEYWTKMLLDHLIYRICLYTILWSPVCCYVVLGDVVL